MQNDLAKWMEQVKIAERGTEQMKIAMNSHGTIVYMKQTN